MASIQMNMGTETEINATPNKDGLILFDTTNKKIILDNNGTREVLTKHIEANPNLNGAEQLENLKVNGEVLNFLPVDISNVEKDGEEISDILKDKYDTEGDYNTTVDKCTDLTRATPVTDTAPYIYRQTPVKESFKALMKKIVGASVVWNQLGFKTGASATALYTPMFQQQGIANTTDVINGHKYYLSFVQPSGCRVYRQDRANITVGYLAYEPPTQNTRRDIVGICTESGTGVSLNSIISKGATTEEAYSLTNCMFVDLTAMFGTTIADYVYTLETSQSGSGIAWLQSYGFFTEDYYAYKQNKLESGCVSAKKIVGTNLFNKTRASLISATTCDYARNDGGIWLFEGFTYTLSIGKTISSMGVYYYGGETESSNRIGYASSTNTLTFTPTKTTKAFIRIYANNTLGGLSQSDINTVQLEIGSTATSYVPYAVTTYPISPITLRGLFKLSTDKLTVDGDEYNADGSVTRKYGIVDLGSLEWTSANGNRFLAYVNDLNFKIDSSYSTPRNALCQDYLWVEGSVLYNNDIKGFSYYIESQRYKLFIKDTSYATAEAFTTAMSGKYLIYELETPTTEQTTPFTETEIVGSTEEFIDYEVAQGNRDVAIPVGTETDYYQSYNIPPMPFTDCYLSASNQNLGWISNS